MSQLTVSMVNWLGDMSAEKLMNPELIFKRVRLIKGLISQKEKEIKSLDERLLGTLYAIIGKSRQEAKEEKRQEIMFFQNLLTKLQNNRKVHQHLRNISKFDIPSLRDVGRKIDELVGFKIRFEDPFLRNFTMSPAEREEYDRMKNKIRQERIIEERLRMEGKKISRFEVEQRIKKEKQESFNKLKEDLFKQIPGGS